MEKIETLKKDEKNDLIRLTVKNLGFPSGATTDEIYKKAEKFGLELCPTEVRQHFRLQNQSHDLMFIAMKQITDHNGLLDVFCLNTIVRQLLLIGGYAMPSDGWECQRRVCFPLPQVGNLETLPLGNF